MANLETVSQWVLEINCFQLKVKKKRKEKELEQVPKPPGWNAMFGLIGRKQALTSQEMKWLAQAGLMFPLLRSNGPFYCGDTRAPAFVHTQPMVNSAARLLKAFKCLWWLSAVMPRGLEFLRPPQITPPLPPLPNPQHLTKGAGGRRGLQWSVTVEKTQD